MSYVEIAKRRKRNAIVLLVATIALSVGGSVFLIRNPEYISRLEREGLTGLFLMSVLAGSPLPIPTPSMILTFTLGSLLNPLLVGAVSSAGDTLGNVIVYVSGRGGIRLFPSLDIQDPASKTPSSRIGRLLTRVTTRMTNFADRRGMISIFVLSVIPNPVLTPMVFGMGATRYPFKKFFLPCLAGNTVQSMILSYLGYFGLRSLLRYFGIFNIP